MCFHKYHPRSALKSGFNTQVVIVHLMVCVETLLSLVEYICGFAGENPHNSEGLNTEWDKENIKTGDLFSMWVLREPSTEVDTGSDFSLVGGWNFSFFSSTKERDKQQIRVFYFFKMWLILTF